MSVWEEQQVEERILEILDDVPLNNEFHQFGRPFITAYQLAIEMQTRYPEVAETLGYPLGGAGAGQRNTLAQYLAGELSRRIGRDPDYRVQGGFVSNMNLEGLTYRGPAGQQIVSSLTDTPYDLSMFRLSPELRGAV